MADMPSKQCSGLLAQKQVQLRTHWFNPGGFLEVVPWGLGLWL